MPECAWKPNWEETKQHFTEWWRRDGLVISMWGAPPSDHPRSGPPAPERPATVAEAYTNNAWRVRKIHHDLSRSAFPADIVPIADTNLGPGSLATFLGAEPRFTPETVWYTPCMEGIDAPEDLPPLRFDPENRWWRLTEDLLRQSRAQAGTDYMVGCPDLVENIDILAALRDPQTVLLDMIERPDWVRAKLREINQVWFEAYRRIYDIIKLSDGSSACWAFYHWGPGKTAKVQCDLSAMFSPAMFAEIVLPSLTEQCEWLDHSVYHLDGTQALCHLDHLLGIGALDAIEWTPQAGIERGGSPRWYDLYRRILAAGKSVQIVDVMPEEVPPLLNAIGTKGVHILTQFRNEREAADLAARVKRPRRQATFS
ncbi:MAG: hypothetical protein PHQ12_01095 [Chthoniobacteraceae bacterium]|nr:hypothetical protein [Chthoniobacteraceae bacterium]